MQVVDLIVKHLDAYRQFGMFGREDVNGVAAHAEGAATEIDFVTAVLHLDQAGNDIALGNLVLGAQGQNHLVIFARVANTVNCRNSCYDDNVAAFHQRFGAGQPHLFNVLVDRGIFLDEQIALRHISFRLVVIVVADEIFDGVAGEKLAEFAIQLRCQGLVGGKNDSRTSEAGNGVCHGIGLAGAGYA